MKKVTLLAMMCLMALSMQAQRCAVLEFKAGVGISQTDVDGISAIFITYFRPAGYTMVERTQIDKAIDEQGFQRSKMTESQMVRIGQILNVSKVVVGDVNIVMGQYNVDTRVINVETGTVAATEGATFSTGSSYRSTMQSLAQKLAEKISIASGSTVQAPTTATPNTRSRNKVEVIYGYLKIFPNELGVFQSEPTSVIAQINKQAQHGYNNWRIPTNEELSLMRANGYLGGGEYMTCQSKRGIVLLVTDGEDYQTLQSKERAAYVDLGLPSGTLWKDKNEGSFYTYEQALNKFGDKLPTKEQFEELKNKCQWSWTDGGYKVTGTNGNSIFLPAEDYANCNGILAHDGGGFYWSSTPYSSTSACTLYFYYSPYSKYVSMSGSDRCYRQSIRLVQD